jgi:hypothetical protein
MDCTKCTSIDAQVCDSELIPISVMKLLIYRLYGRVAEAWMSVDVIGHQIAIVNQNT